MKPAKLRKRTPSDLALWAALPMAHTSRIEGRLRIILGHTRRHVMTRPALVVMVVLASGIVLGVATAYTPPRSLMAAITSGGYRPDTPAHLEANIAYFQAAIRRFGDHDPWAGKAYYVLGNAQMEAGRYDDALASYDKAATLPEPPYAGSGIHSFARYERINTLEFAGRYEEAVTETTAMLKNGDRGLIAGDLRGNLRERLSEFQFMRDDVANRAAEKAQYSSLIANQRWTQTLANGVTVQLLGVMESQGKLHTVWSPDGHFLSRASYKPLAGLTSLKQPAQPKEREIILRFQYPNTKAILTAYKVADSISSGYETGLARSNGIVMTDENQMNPETLGCRIVQAWFPQSQNQTALRIGVALVPPPLGPNDPADAPQEWAEFSNIALSPIK